MERDPRANSRRVREPSDTPSGENGDADFKKGWNREQASYRVAPGSGDKADNEAAFGDYLRGIDHGSLESARGIQHLLVDWKVYPGDFAEIAATLKPSWPLYWTAEFKLARMFESGSGVIRSDGFACYLYRAALKEAPGFEAARIGEIRTCYEARSGIEDMQRRKMLADFDKQDVPSQNIPPGSE